MTQFANFLPGPVEVTPRVREALIREPISHRSEEYHGLLAETCDSLCKLVGAEKCAVVCGSGTLANDIVAAQLGQLNRSGIVLSNGEFGERLIEQASRAKLKFHALRLPYGQSFTRKDIEAAFELYPGIDWLWCCHCETSTGVLNDLRSIEKICRERDCKLCVDCISSLGTVEVELKNVFLASGTSGKGLASYPGLGLVFHNHEILPSEHMPRYLDLGLYTVCGGVPFTCSSNLLLALHVALEELRVPERFTHLLQASLGLREHLEDMRFQLVARHENQAPAVITLCLPKNINSLHIGQVMERHGYLLSYRSHYLLRNNWVQICLMGQFTGNVVTMLPRVLHNAIGKAL